MKDVQDHVSDSRIYREINIKRMRKGMIWAGHAACMGKGKGDGHTGFWWGNLMNRDHLEVPGIDGRIILK
jgi:hypothetical protein